jgi:sensor histidine kinase regulating citrate/malate metabolism
MVDILAECYRRASRAREHQHMVDLMAIAGLLCKGLTEAQIEQAKLIAED